MYIRRYDSPLETCENEAEGLSVTVPENYSGNAFSPAKEVKEARETQEEEAEQEAAFALTSHTENTQNKDLLTTLFALLLSEEAQEDILGLLIVLLLI